MVNAMNQKRMGPWYRERRANASRRCCAVATASAVIGPDGKLISYQPYGEEGLLIADIDLMAATGLLAARYTPMA